MPTESRDVRRGDITQHSSGRGSRLIVIRVSTHDLLWPNELFVRANDFAKRRSNEPQRNSTSDQGIEERISRGSYENASKPLRGLSQAKSVSVGKDASLHTANVPA